MFTLELIILGLLTGIITGLTGASGVLVLVPILSTFSDIPLPIILGTSLFVDVIACIPVSYAYAKAKNLDVKSVGWIIAGALLGAQIGSYFVVSVSKSLIMGIISIGMIYFGIKMWQSGFSKEKELSIRIPERLSFYMKTQVGMILSGLLIGLTTGIFGAGGGLTVFIILFSFLNFPLKKAIGTSSFVMLITALSGVLGYFGNDNLHFSYGIILGISAFIGGALSSTIANKMPEKRLSRFIGVFFVSLAIIVIFLKVIIPVFKIEM
ncbi:TPA: sulfite exporter TauE/SafE family protein [Candidatus Nomurabacteria bacterium]|nr:MAG: Conserved protein YunE [Parcubacteria bacterium RAAC4_OD1_1]HCY26296.1 sulfite exporter TauE/SafE family protein [Candidatus Nomurabacteria bacterium]